MKKVAWIQIARLQFQAEASKIMHGSRFSKTGTQKLRGFKFHTLQLELLFEKSFMDPSFPNWSAGLNTDVSVVGAPETCNPQFHIHPGQYGHASHWMVAETLKQCMSARTSSFCNVCLPAHHFFAMYVCPNIRCAQMCAVYVCLNKYCRCCTSRQTSDVSQLYPEFLAERGLPKWVHVST